MFSTLFKPNFNFFSHIYFVVFKCFQYGNQHFLLFPQCFLPFSKPNFNFFSVTFTLSSSNAFNLDQCKILSFGRVKPGYIESKSNCEIISIHSHGNDQRSSVTVRINCENTGLKAKKIIYLLRFQSMYSSNLNLYLICQF